MEIVLDASIGVKWFNTKGEDNVDIALEIQNQKADNIIEVIVPDLFFLEILNAFLTRSFLKLEELITIEESLIMMNFKVSYPNNTSLRNAISIAHDNNLTIYDSIYIETARENNAILVTEDKKILLTKNKYGFIKSLEEFGRLL